VTGKKWLMGFIGLLLLGSCGTRPETDRVHDRTVISRPDVIAYLMGGGRDDVWQMLRDLRPLWLYERTGGYPKVFVNGGEFGEVYDLHNIPAHLVRQVSFDRPSAVPIQYRAYRQRGIIWVEL